MGNPEKARDPEKEKQAVSGVWASLDLTSQNSPNSPSHCSQSYFHLPPSTRCSSPDPQAGVSPYPPCAGNLGQHFVGFEASHNRYLTRDLPCLWALFYWVIWLIPKVLRRVTIKAVTLKEKPLLQPQKPESQLQDQRWVPDISWDDAPFDIYFFKTLLRSQAKLKIT